MGNKEDEQNELDGERGGLTERYANSDDGLQVEVTGIGATVRDELLDGLNLSSGMSKIRIVDTHRLRWGIGKGIKSNSLRTMRTRLTAAIMNA